jgi:hypothetical protein
MVHAYDPYTQETEAGRYRVQGSLGYTRRHSLKKKKENLIFSKSKRNKRNGR